MTRDSRGLGILALSVTGIMFGTTFLIVQNAIDRAAVAPFLAVRFLIGAAVLAPFTFRRPSTPGVRRDGVLAGSCLLGAYLLQTVGLRHVGAASSAFITYLLIVFVPLMVAVRTRRAPGPPVVVGVALSVIGLWLLSGGVSGLGRGELLTLGCAFLFGLHIVVLGEVAHRHDPFHLTFWQVLTVSLACFVPPLLDGRDAIAAFRFDGGVWTAAAVCGIGATAIAFWCMSYAQRVVPEALAAIVLLLEPVSAGILGEITGDHLGWRGGAGAALILVAVIVTELLGRTGPEAIGTEMVIVDPGPPPGTAIRPAAPDRSSAGDPPEGAEPRPHDAGPVEADGPDRTAGDVVS